MEKSIRVHVMGREYALRVQEEAEELTRELAHYVDAKMRAFRSAFPNQPEVTTAVIAALAIAEELHQARGADRELLRQVDAELQSLDQVLANGFAPLPAADEPAGDG